ncbi:competence protein ComK [Halalkalibacter urbisdiaboli]|uniref:competence protein ComK n=1 Tax=Halalkalibacter urbisdiaboli TaxID=1960589 RepID=UPI000B42F45B|nr:competence protein ComK [Halalkalibacter urbisdiaboli]
MKKIILTDYEINKDTMALQPATDIGYETIVVERNQVLYVNKTPLQLIEAACLEGGASYEGRREAVSYLIGARNKVPLPISPGEHIYALPTHSPKQFECIWLFYYHIKTFKPDPKFPNQTIIIFKSNLDLTLNVSYSTIEKQMQRTSYCIVRYSQKLIHLPLVAEHNSLMTIGW